jgi:hypothetical protein
LKTEPLARRDKDKENAPVAAAETHLEFGYRL